MNRNDAEQVIKETIEYANNEIKKNRKKSRRIVIATIVSAVLIIALVGSCFFSYEKFNTFNPFSAAFGFCQITVFEKEYVEIQKSPKVMLAQPDYEVLVDYMKSRGFTEIKEEQMGAMHVFTNGDEKERILYSQNARFSKWRWE